MSDSMMKLGLIYISFLLIIKVKTETSIRDQIRRVKENVLKYCASNPELVHQIDCQRIETKDWITERYLLDNENDEKSAEKAIISSLEFYWKENIHELNDIYFPAEFYSTGSAFLFGKSKTNQPVLGFIPRCIYTFSSISDDMFKLALKYVYYLDKKLRFSQDANNSYVYAVMTDFGLSNIEYGFINSVINFVNHHSPRTPSVASVLDLGFFMELTVKLIIELFNKDMKQRIRFSSLQNVEEWISLDEIPVHAGGKNKNFKRIPDGVKSGKCLPHLRHIPNEDWDAFKNQNIDCILEGVAESGISSMDEFLRYKC